MERALTMRLHKTVRAELRRIEVLVTRCADAPSFAEGFVKGAQQALAWALHQNAVAPSKCVQVAEERAIVDQLEKDMDAVDAMVAAARRHL